MTAWGGEQARRAPGTCLHHVGVTVHPPVGQPSGRDPLPAEVAELYRGCGGMYLSPHTAFPLSIVPPDGWVCANLAVLGEEFPDDRSHHWCVLARCGDQVISVDASSGREGWCVDSFWDRHGVAGSCAVIARTVGDLLETLLAAGGGQLFWLADDFVGLGDAYD